jgi:hypothetical protein
MNAAMALENQSLQYDNKQLNTLIKDFETTLESVMSTFRNKAVSTPFFPRHFDDDVGVYVERSPRTRAVADA